MQDGPYPWAIVSDPVRAFLFVLVRDPKKFYGSAQEKEVLKLCKDLGFTTFWNFPRKTVQEGCSYTSTSATVTADDVEVVAPAAGADEFEMAIQASRTWLFESVIC